MREVLVVGGGRIGAYVVGLLIEQGHDVVVVEHDAARAEHLRSAFPGRVVHGSGSDPEVLEGAGARRAGTVVAVTERDETNLVVTSLAKLEFGVPRTIARVNDPANAWLYTAELGVDVALNQADVIGHLVAEEMSLGEMTTLRKLRRGQFALVEEEVHATSAAAGRTVADLGLPPGCLLVAVLRDQSVTSPAGSTVLNAGDEVLAVVRIDLAEQLAGILGPA